MKIEVLNLGTRGLDFGSLVDRVAHYLSANGCPNWFCRRVDFHCGYGQSNGWLVSKFESDALLRINKAYMRRHGLYTLNGYMYVSRHGNEAAFCVDGCYYYMSK